MYLIFNFIIALLFIETDIYIYIYRWIGLRENLNRKAP